MICTALLVSMTLGCQSTNFKMPSMPKMPSFADMAENRPRLFAKKDKGELPPPSRHFDTIKNDAQVARNESLDIDTGKPVPPSQASQPFGQTPKEVASQGDRFKTPDVAGYAESKGPGIRQPYQYEGDKQDGVKDAAKALAENWKGLDRIDNMPNSLPVSSGEFSSEFAAANRKPAELPSEFSLPGIAASTPKSSDFEFPGTSPSRSVAMSQGVSNSFAPAAQPNMGTANFEGLSPAPNASAMNPTNSFAASQNQFGTSGSLNPMEGTNQLSPLNGSSSHPFGNTNSSEMQSGNAPSAVEYPRTAQADNTFDRVLSQSGMAQGQPSATSNFNSFGSSNDSGSSSFAASGSNPQDRVDLGPVTKNQNYMVQNPFANESLPDRQDLAAQPKPLEASPSAIRSARLPDSLRTSSGYAPGSTGRRTAF
jgi:hypothetical protein